MILRRISEHVKAQNWFAVGVDLVIVVGGVFIGIEVQQWADAQGGIDKLTVSGEVELPPNLTPQRLHSNF